MAYISMHEIQTKLDSLFGASVSTAMMQDSMIRGLFSSSHASSSYPAMADMSAYDPRMLVWLDDMGCDRRNTLHKYGYSLRGIPVSDHHLLVWGKLYSAIPVMSLDVFMMSVYVTEGNRK